MMMKRPRSDSISSEDTIGLDDNSADDETSSPSITANLVVKRIKSSSSDLQTASTAISRHKRPRTERYITECKNLAKQREAVDFFQQRLALIQQKTNERFSGGGAMVGTRPLLVARNLQQSWLSQTQEFLEFRQQMMESAQRRIHLKQCIEAMQRQLLQQQSEQKNQIVPFQQLQQGQETTAALMELIADFAGIPSDGETMDCWDLLDVARSTARL